MRAPAFLFMILAMLAFAPAASVRADDDHGGGHEKRHREADEAYELRRKGNVQPLEAILETVRKTVPGKVVEIEFQKKDNPPVYEIYVLEPSGAVTEVHVDARSGLVLKTSPKD